jgi:methyltransferase (TIGR00027 family)
MDRSLIAGANAWFRAAETERPDRILSDPFAIHLAERDPRIQAVRFGRFVAPPLAREIEALKVAHCVRHAAIDRLLLDAVAAGFDQIVIVGAGYDMRAARFAQPLAGARIIEIDHPGTQARKIERLRKVRCAVDVERAAADLLIDDLHAALERARWNPKRATSFVVEGFLHYLSPHRFDALLSSMARAQSARLIASYIRTDMYLRGDSVFLELIKLVREIPRLHFAPDDLARRFEQHGFHGFRSWDIARQIADLVPHAEGRYVRLTQDVAVAERSSRVRWAR